MADDNANQSPTESTSSRESTSATENQGSIPQIRLQQPLPPLPRMQIQIPYQSNSPLSAYTDDSFLTPNSPQQHSRITLKDTNEGSPTEASQADQPQVNRIRPAPPDYEPMHDYLRALALHRQERPLRYYSPTSNTFLSPASRLQSPSLYMPYSDSPTSPDGQQRAIITLSPLSPTGDSNQHTPSDPPSYEELYLQHPCPIQQSRLLELVRQLEETESSLAEEVCKFAIGLVFVVLIVLIVGIVFNWGRPFPSLSSSVRPQPIVQGGMPVRLHSMPRLGSMTKIGKFKTLCGGRCKMHA
jgi:hypothetical protein